MVGDVLLTFDNAIKYNPASDKVLQGGRKRWQAGVRLEAQRTRKERKAVKVVS